MSEVQPIPLLYSGQVENYFGTEYERFDEYTVRQESNSGHIFLQLAGGFARSRMAQMMAENADEEDETRMRNTI